MSNTDNRDFDEAFYLQSYPLARLEVERGVASTAWRHYESLGKARGYLPSRHGPRHYSRNGAPSPFGGLWTDSEQAGDRVARMLAEKRITNTQAGQLADWMRDGYVVLEGAISPKLIDAAVSDLDKAYAGGFDKVLFECHKINGSSNIPWHPDVQEFAAKVLDLHHFSPAMRNIMFAPEIGRFLELIFEDSALASQTLGFWRGSGQEGHQDSAYVPFTLPRSFAATWIALEDVTIGAGELFYYVGSHKFPDFLYGGKHKCIAEAERLGYGVQRAEVEQHVASLRELAKQRGIEKTVFAARKGDVLVWHADLVHGGNPVSKSLTRKSFVTHYCPRTLSPLFSEHMATDLFEHKGHYLTSHLYPFRDYDESSLLGSAVHWLKGRKPK